MNQQQTISYIKSKAKAFELYFAESEMLNIEINNNMINFISGGSSMGMGVRVFHEGKLGFAYTNNIEHYKECIEKALKIAKVSSVDSDFKKFAMPERYKKLAFVDKKLEAFDEESFVGFHNTFMENVRRVDKRIVVSNGSYTKGAETVRVVNSEGVDFEERSMENIFDCSLSIKVDGKLESIDAVNGDVKVLSPGTGTETANRLMGFLNRQDIESNNIQLLLHPEMVASLFEQSFVYAINSENVQQKKSIFAGKLGQVVCDKKLNIEDEAVTKGLFCTRSCDCEGTPSQKTAITNKGVLKSLIYNTYTANKEGVKSTANAYRGISTLPTIDANNFIIKPGNKPAIINEVDKGIYVRNLLGIHTMNASTGDFSLGVNEGYYVEKGEVKFPLKDAMIAGNFFELIKNVTSIGNKLEHCFVGSGGFYVPYMLFPSITVIGKKG